MIGLTIFVTIVLGAIFVAFGIGIYREIVHFDKLPTDPNREPQQSDFPPRPGAALEATQQYYEAHREWEKRRAKQIVYDLPLAEVLGLEELGNAYWREVSTRNRTYYRWTDEYADTSPRCRVCGRDGARGSAVLCSSGHWDSAQGNAVLCSSCRKLMESARKANPDLNFSEELWEHRMMIELDSETGIINASQAEREQAIVRELERRRIQKVKQQHDRAELERQSQQQRRDTIASAASRLK